MKWPRRRGVLRIQRMNRWVRYPGRQAYRRPGVYTYSNPPRAAVDVSRTRSRHRR